MAARRGKNRRRCSCARVVAEQGDDGRLRYLQSRRHIARRVACIGEVACADRNSGMVVGLCSTRRASSVITWATRIRRQVARTCTRSLAARRLHRPWLLVSRRAPCGDRRSFSRDGQRSARLDWISRRSQIEPFENIRPLIVSRAQALTPDQRVFAFRAALAGAADDVKLSLACAAKAARFVGLVRSLARRCRRSDPRQRLAARSVVLISCAAAILVVNFLSSFSISSLTAQYCRWLPLRPDVRDFFFR